MTEARTQPRPLIYAPPPPGPLPILYEDSHFIVLDKPSGLLTVPGKTPGHADCLETRVRDRFPRAVVVHRLDLDTSGVIVMALTHQAQRHLGRQFEKRRTRKRYIARVHGVMAETQGLVDLPLICDWPNRPRQMVDHDQGKPAITRWRVLAREKAATRVMLLPETGRSHQLRVHMLSLGHPMLGDNLYASDEVLAAADRLQLHSQALRFRHPDGGRWCCFTSPCPF